ncbi:MAG TPA: hypothetical protein DDW52_03620 [Planctomycetaceae bacterium]|nr:hypothetical protein [Planctomycetaceae bacterium]
MVVKKFPIASLYQRIWDGRLESHQRIWSQAKHNAFTDLCRFREKYYCVFREGTQHVSPDGALRVLQSSDLKDWRSVALVESTEGDLRDAKLTVTDGGELMLSGAVAYPASRDARHQSLAWFSRDGETWGKAHPIGPVNYWLWRTVWNRGQALNIGYHTGASDDRFVSLFSSTDGRKFDTLVDRLFERGYPNETCWLFDEDGTAHVVLRRDGDEPTAQLGTSVPPYREWTWLDLGVRVGGPQIIQVPDGRVFLAGRLYTSETADGRTIPDVRTSLMRLELESATVTEVLRLPSGGDTSYPGLLWHGGRLFVSYYSSHESTAIAENPDCRTAIYMAVVKVD